MMRTPRGGTHILGAREDAAFISKQTLFEQKSFQAGIQFSSMAAALLDKTVIVVAFEGNVLHQMYINDYQC